MPGPWKYRPRAGTKKDRKTISAPLSVILDLCSLLRSLAEGENIPEGRESQPQQEDELENKVEGEPVNNAEEALGDGEEGENNPVLGNNLDQYL